jgi:hypothetical protein
MIDRDLSRTTGDLARIDEPRRGCVDVPGPLRLVTPTAGPNRQRRSGGGPEPPSLSCGSASAFTRVDRASPTSRPRGGLLRMWLHAVLRSVRWLQTAAPSSSGSNFQGPSWRTSLA